MSLFMLLLLLLVVVLWRVVVVVVVVVVGVGVGVVAGVVVVGSIDRCYHFVTITTTHLDHYVYELYDLNSQFKDKKTRQRQTTRTQHNT